MHADVNGRWVERKKVGVEGPSSTAAGRSSISSDDASSDASRGKRAAGEGFLSTYLLLSNLSLSVASWYGYVSSVGRVRSRRRSANRLP